MRTIESPGVEIREIDMSFNTELPYGTTSLVLGYAKQGPTDELLNITSADELERIYGLPENAAEMYMYNTAKQVLNANGNLLITRLPYGDEDGAGYGNKYSALVYPYIPVSIPTSDELSEMGVISTENIEVNLTIFENATGIPVAVSGYSLPIKTQNEYYDDGYISYNSMKDSTFKLDAVLLNVSTSATKNVIFEFNKDALTIQGSAHPDLSGDADFNIGVWAATINIEKVVDEKYINLESLQIEINSAESDIKFQSGVLSFDVVGVKFDGSKPVTATPGPSSNFYLGEPIHISIDDKTYFEWQQGNIEWKSVVDAGVSDLSLSGSELLSAVGYGAMIVVNEAKTTIDGKFEGFYVAVADNSKSDKSSNFDSILKTKSFNRLSENHEWLELNGSSLSFDMTGSFNNQSGSISEIVESVPDFDFSHMGGDGYGDSIILTLFKIRPSLYNQETRVLDSVLYETFIGSFDSTRKIQNPNGGSPINFFIEDVINEKSNNLKVFVNPYISKHGGAWYDPNTQESTKRVRVMTGERTVIDENDSTPITIPAEPNGVDKVILDAFNTANGNFLKNADNLYGIGEPVPCDANSNKFIGNLPRKLEKALRLAEDYEQLRIDLVPEAGLGTIWVGAKQIAAKEKNDTLKGLLFDDTTFIDGILTEDSESKTLASQNTGANSKVCGLYQTIANAFNQFCQYTRKDCLQICDPVRYIFVQGDGGKKVLDDKTKNFSQHVYWPLKNLFGALNTSYACTYADWFKISDNINGKFVWTPSSGYAANLMIKTDTNFYPWYAPAGLTRGLLSGILDIGINPTAKQRDLLYKIGINPVVYWPSDGYVVWGQKTLQSKPSAFDRINVRRLFLWAEKAVLPIARFFVFEQNTPFTRNRFKAAIDPILSFAKSNEGLYDYLIVCDERNNTSETIDRNELIVDIYLKATRVAEFVLINFIATRTGQSFEELV